MACDVGVADSVADVLLGRADTVFTGGVVNFMTDI